MSRPFASGTTWQTWVSIGDVLDRRRAIDALHDQVGLVERLLYVALADLPAVHLVLEMRVPVTPLMDPRCIRVERLADVEERRTLLEVGA